MTTAIRIEVLPARMGDCLLVECPRADGTTWRLLVDGGPPDTWPLLEARLERLDPSDRRIDVVVVTHIDSDHIGGMVPFFTSRFARDVGDVWFNGRTHLGEPGADRHEADRSVLQGENVVAALLGRAHPGRVQPPPWNQAFGGGPVQTPAGPGLVEVALPGGPEVTVLSPTPDRLTALRTSWEAVLRAARHSRDRDPVAAADRPGPLGDLETLAARRTPKDSSVPNGSSIALLLEHRGASVVLGADAYGGVLADSLSAVAAARGRPALVVDAVKLPHHGSKNNVVTALVKAAPAAHYLVSTNGDVFHHPDDAALARVVLGAPPGATIGFNYRTARTERWADPGLTTRFGYRAAYPAADRPDAGYVLELPARRRAEHGRGDRI